MGLRRSGLAAAGLLLLFGCTTDAERVPEPTPAGEATPASPTPVPAPAEPDPEGAGPTIHLVPHGLSPLYVGFIEDAAALSRLSGRLGDSVEEQGLVTVEVRWSEERLEGAFSLLVPDKLGAGKPAADSLDAGRAVDLRPIAGLMRSIGAYRQELGERFDIRFAAFGLQLVFWDPVSGSRCRVDGVGNDPEGRGFAECFVCAHPRKGELDVCRSEAAWPSPVKGDKAALRMLSSALRGAAER